MIPYPSLTEFYTRIFPIRHKEHVGTEGEPSKDFRHRVLEIQAIQLNSPQTTTAQDFVSLCFHLGHGSTRTSVIVYWHAEP